MTLMFDRWWRRWQQLPRPEHAAVDRLVRVNADRMRTVQPAVDAARTVVVNLGGPDDPLRASFIRAGKRLGRV